MFISRSFIYWRWLANSEDEFIIHCRKSYLQWPRASVYATVYVVIVSTNYDEMQIILFNQLFNGA